MGIPADVQLSPETQIPETQRLEVVMSASAEELCQAASQARLAGHERYSELVGPCMECRRRARTGEPYEVSSGREDAPPPGERRSLRLPVRGLPILPETMSHLRGISGTKPPAPPARELPEESGSHHLREAVARWWRRNP